MFNSSGVDVICVADATARTGNVPETLGKDIVLSAVGSTVVNVVSWASAVAPSNTKAFWILTVVESTVVVWPETDKLPAMVTFAPLNVIALLPPLAIVLVVSVVIVCEVAVPPTTPLIVGAVKVLFVSVEDVPETKVSICEALSLFSVPPSDTTNLSVAAKVIPVPSAYESMSNPNSALT